MDFSIVIPSFNGKELLRKTLLALRKSDAQPLKYIVVDDCSSDGTSEMIKREFFDEDYFMFGEGPDLSRRSAALSIKSAIAKFVDNIMNKRYCFLYSHPH